jgi:hypothetical protein
MSRRDVRRCWKIRSGIFRLPGARMRRQTPAMEDNEPEQCAMSNRNEEQPDEPGKKDELDFDDDTDLDQLMTVREAAAILRIGRSTLNHYRCEGRGPIYRKHGARVFYTKRSLLRWSRRDRYRSTSQRVRRDK